MRTRCSIAHKPRLCSFRSHKPGTFVFDAAKSPWHIGQTVEMYERPAGPGSDSPAHLLSLIRSGKASTRGDLVRVTGLARSTIAQRVDSLLSSGLLIETGEAPSTGGRPPTMLGFNGDAGVVLAADLGATHSLIAITNLAAMPLVEETAEWDIDDGPESILERLESTFDDLLGRPGGPSSLRGIGIGLPGPVDFSRGMAINPPIMAGWNEYPVAERFSDRYHVPVLVDNDVNIMAIGEHFAAERSVPDLLFVKVGTGIGSGLILGGRLHRGAQGAAGDMGHVQAAGQEVVCRCGNNGCLEAAAGGAALAAALGEHRDGIVDSRDVVRLVNEGDEEAIRAVRSAGRLIGQVLAGMVNLLNPAVIVIGGDMAAAEQQLLAGIREVVYRRSTTLSTTALEIKRTTLGDSAGITGAAAMVIDHLLEPGNLETAIVAAAAKAG